MGAAHITRRQWFRAVASGMGVAGASALGFSAGAAAPNQAWRSSFAPFDNVRTTSLDTTELTVEGKLPQALQGTLYRNGPARFVLGESRLTHWFDGDGMVQAITIAQGKASHKGRLLQTPKRIEEDAAGRYLYGSFGSTPAKSLPLRRPDQTNSANINVLALSQSKALFALWEGGSALALDPVTLDSRGFKVWSPDTAGAPFGAHPRVSHDGTVWNFGYAPGSGKLIIYHIAASGELLRQAIIDLPQADMVHDFAITENHLIFLLQPLVFDRKGLRDEGLLSAYSWDAKAPLIAAVVSKNDWAVTRMDLPNGGVFHLGNAHEVGGKIHFGYALNTDFLPMTRNLHQVQGLASATESRAALYSNIQWTHVELDVAAKRVMQTKTPWSGIEFPRFDQRRTGEKSELTILLQRSATMHPAVDGMDTVLSLWAPMGAAKSSIQTQRYHYGDEWIAEEHLYVPHPTNRAESAGWIMGSAYHWPSEKTSVCVFEASALAKGPVATLRLPYGLPLGLHGQFVSA